MLDLTVGQASRFVLFALAIALPLGPGLAAHAAEDPIKDYLHYPYDKIVPKEDQECAVCHFQTVESWKETAHKKTYDTLHKNDRAKEIVALMGGRRIKASPICTQCHYTMVTEKKAVMGVSCQRCHGPAADWMKPHADTETIPDRFARLAPLEDLGMRPTYKLYELAQSCYQCHTVPMEDLVNTGGHNAGSADFELVAWSQGEVRHNFLPLPDEAKNKERDAKYLENLFVIGKLLDLEWSLRGRANATMPGPYKDEMDKRVSKAVDALKEMGGDAAKVLDEVPASFDDTELVGDAAERVGRIAKDFSDNIYAEMKDGAQLKFGRGKAAGLRCFSAGGRGRVKET